MTHRYQAATYVGSYKSTVKIQERPGVRLGEIYSKKKPRLPEVRRHVSLGFKFFRFRFRFVVFALRGRCSGSRGGSGGRGGGFGWC